MMGSAIIPLTSPVAHNKRMQLLSRKRRKNAVLKNESAKEVIVIFQEGCLELGPLKAFREMIIMDSTENVSSSDVCETKLIREI